MAYLNQHLMNKLNTLTPRNKELLEQFLIDLSQANNEIEKRDAVTRLRSRIREIVAEEEGR